MIPRIFHQIWLGTVPMHPLMLSWRQRWQALHPEWEHWLWTESADDPCALTCGSRRLFSCHPGLLASACHLSQRSNIWRYQVVCAFGGVYLDADVEPFRPIDELVGHLDAFAVPRMRPEGYFENAVFGAELEHTWVRDLLRGLPNRDPATSLSMGVDYLTLVLRWHPEVARLQKGAFIFEYPDPDPWLAIRRGETIAPPPELSAPPEGAYALHHWSSHWFAESFRRVTA
jgi:hypothetical protein